MWPLWAFGAVLTVCARRPLSAVLTVSAWRPLSAVLTVSAWRPLSAVLTVSAWRPRYPQVVAVAVTTPTDGTVCFSAVGPEVELAAPGFNVYSTYKDAGYAVESGTSMSAPHVAGVAALVIASGNLTDEDGDGDQDNDDVRKRLQDTAEDVGLPATVAGYGLVDAEAAVGAPQPLPNTPPAAQDVSASGTQGSLVPWLPAVSDDDGDALTCTIAVPPTSGGAAVAGDCSSGTYTPGQAFTGTDSFVYRVSDGTDSDTGTVTVTIAPTPTTSLTFSPTDDATVWATKPDTNYGAEPMVEIDKGSQGLDKQALLKFAVTGVSGSVTAAEIRLYVTNPSSSGGSLRGVSDTTWSQATVTWRSKPAIDGALLSTAGAASFGSWVSFDVTSAIAGNGLYSFAITPNSFDGVDYSSMEAQSNRPVLVVDYGTSSSAPIADDVAAAGDEDTLIPWTPSVTDADGDTLTCTIDSLPTAGTATVASDCGSGSYTPAADFHGADLFRYRVSDGTASDTGAVSVTVFPVNDAPVADPGGPYAGTEDVPLTFDGSGSSDPDGDPLAYRWDFGDGDTDTGASPAHTYIAGGLYIVTLIVNDGIVDSAPVATTASIVAVDDPPVADPGGPYAGTEDVPLTFDGSGSSDPDGDPLTFRWDFGDGDAGTGVSPAHTYLAGGLYIVTLIVNDGTQDSAPAATTASIAAVNDPPVAEDVSASGDEDTVIAWLPSVSDVDGDALTCAIDTPPTSGSATVAADCTGGSYTPAADFHGADGFSYSAFDGAAADTASVAVTILAVNDPPAAGDVSVSGLEGSTVVWSPSASDVDGDALTCSISTPPSSGSATAAFDCSGGSYIPSPGFVGTDVFTYLVWDGAAGDFGTVTATVDPVLPSSLVFAATDDATVWGRKPDRNYGSATSLEVDKAGDGRGKEAYFKFVVAGVSGTVESATLRLYVTNSSKKGGTIRRVWDTTWSEAAITWDNRPPSDASGLYTVGTATSGTWVAFDLTQAISGNGVYAFVITPDSFDGVDYGSKERSSNNPSLEIELTNSPPVAGDATVAGDEDAVIAWTLRSATLTATRSPARSSTRPTAAPPPSPPTARPAPTRRTPSTAAPTS